MAEGEQKKPNRRLDEQKHSNERHHRTDLSQKWKTREQRTQPVPGEGTMRKQINNVRFSHSVVDRKRNPTRRQHSKGRRESPGYSRVHITRSPVPMKDRTAKSTCIPAEEPLSQIADIVAKPEQEIRNKDSVELNSVDPLTEKKEIKRDTEIDSANQLKIEKSPGRLQTNIRVKYRKSPLVTNTLQMVDSPLPRDSTKK